MNNRGEYQWEVVEQQEGVRRSDEVAIAELALIGTIKAYEEASAVFQRTSLEEVKGKGSDQKNEAIFKDAKAEWEFAFKRAQAVALADRVAKQAAAAGGPQGLPLEVVNLAFSSLFPINKKSLPGKRASEEKKVPDYVMENISDTGFRL